ncbi:uncharacterized protein LOC111277596 [Durio zibethinus]|uniref:Uncharacterized protein LOC111277596 n=1 Tax=Durio zibethinus TaxID=66656 RepID=A0A6P5WUC8_DURZI|nr:uncharacterized protein LOC111277596 [Durio zibethinus]
MKMLLAKRESVQKEIEVAERNVEKIKPHVELWCSTVDKVIKDEVKSVKDLQDKATTKCFIGLCPNIKSRYQLSRKAEEVVAAVNEHLQQGEFNSVSCPAPPPEIVDATPKDFENFESRAMVFKDITEALKDDTINVIGVYGMAGVGKTTLVKEVARQVKENKLFDSVIMAIVNQTPDVQKIQDQLADLLGLKLEETSMVVRAGRLRERLKKEKKVLVILDDIWKKLDLNDVGIPLGDENKGCNILLTSRDLNVLRNEMDAQKNFALSVLEGKEAWDLFKKMAGDDAESPELRSTAIEVAKKCAGLPVAIVTVARALRNKGSFAWNDALRKLQRPSPTNFTGIPAHIYSAIELSYNQLESEELKQTFLLCGLLGHNTAIGDLLKYTIGLGLFHGVNTVEETRDRLLTVVSDLKSSCLLHDSYTNVRVDMHDLICDVALAIASRDNNVFALKDEDVLKDWPNGETMEKCTMISLRYANISYFPKELKCPRLTFFFVGSKDSSVKIPTSFFMEMKNLEVLDLTKMHFSYLPSSISLLKNLRTLCLDQCVLGDITLIGELKNLEILSLLSSDIEMLPKEIGQLVKLKLLDLSDCTKLKIIPKDLFPAKLKRYKIFIGDQARDRFFKNECLRALNLKLNTSIHHLDPGIKRLLMNTEDLYLEEMKGAKIVLPEFHDWHCFRYLKNLHIQNGLEIQYIVDDHDAVDIIEFLQLRSLTLEDLPKLVSFCSENKPGSAFIPQHQLPLFSRKMVFPCLENLHLSSINVERIWHSQLSNKSDYTQNLTSCISYFGKDEPIALEQYEDDMAQPPVCKFLLQTGKNGGNHTFGFPSLDQVIVSQCSELEIFCKGELNAPTLQRVQVTDKDEKGHWDGDLNSTIQQLFKKKVDYEPMEYLMLTEFSKAIEIWRDNLQKSLNLKNLKCLEVYECNSMTYVFTTSMVLDLVQLKQMQVRNCPMMEQIITNDGVEEAATNTIMFPSLQSISIVSCSNLRSFYLGSNTVECPYLTALGLMDCPKMVAFISSSPREQNIDNIGIAPLFNDKVKGCDNVEILARQYLSFSETLRESQSEIISFQQPLFCVTENAFPNLEWLLLEKNDIMMEIWHGQLPTQYFCKLTDLWLERVPNRSVTILNSFTHLLPNLEKLVVREAPFSNIFQCEGLGGEEEHPGTLARLSELTLHELPELTHIWKEEFQVGEVFSNLSTLQLWKCDKLKNLVPSYVYFKHLTTLEVSNCQGLKNLVALPTAKSMVALTKLRIIDCQMIEETIAYGSDDVKDGIVFSQLKSLELCSLPILSSFCSGDYAFEFPSLEEVIVRNCPKMEIFCGGELATPSLRRVQFAEDKERWDGNLNTTMEQIFIEMNFFIVGVVLLCFRMNGAHLCSTTNPVKAAMFQGSRSLFLYLTMYLDSSSDFDILKDLVYEYFSSSYRAEFSEICGSFNRVWFHFYYDVVMFRECPEFYSGGRLSDTSSSWIKRNVFYGFERSASPYVLLRIKDEWSTLSTTTNPVKAAMFQGSRSLFHYLPIHILLCIYGTIAIGLVLAGRLKELKVVYILTVELLTLYSRYFEFNKLSIGLSQWLLCLYNTQTFKWQDYFGWRKKLSAARAKPCSIKGKHHLDE